MKGLLELAKALQFLRRPAVGAAGLMRPAQTAGAELPLVALPVHGGLPPDRAGTRTGTGDHRTNARNCSPTNSRGWVDASHPAVQVTPQQSGRERRFPN